MSVVRVWRISFLLPFRFTYDHGLSRHLSRKKKKKRRRKREGRGCCSNSVCPRTPLDFQNFQAHKGVTAAAAATEDKDRVDTCSTPSIFCVHGIQYVIIMTKARLFFVKRGAVLKMHPTSFSLFFVGCCLHASVASAMSVVDTALLLLQ